MKFAFVGDGVHDVPPKGRTTLSARRKRGTRNDRPQLRFNCSCNLSAIMAMNSELVGLPLAEFTV